MESREDLTAGFDGERPMRRLFLTAVPLRGETLPTLQWEDEADKDGK